MKQKITSLILCGILCCSVVQAQESSFETNARGWIKENTRSLGIPGFTELTLRSVRKGNTGETLRFQQMVKDVPVFQSEIVIHFNKEGKISYTGTESLKHNLKEVSTVPSFPASEAVKKAHIASASKGQITYEENKLFIYITDSGDTKLVYRVLTSSFDNPGSWETIVDAKTGTVISMKDIAVKHHDKNEPSPKKKNEKIKAKKASVTGSAYIFQPDPLSKTGSTYAGNFVDNNDATNASLDAARTLVTIPEIDLTGGVYTLKGTYAEIKEIEAPAKGIFTQSTNQFLFNRSDDGFEAANAYWHLDNSLRYINVTLGIVCKPSQNNGVLRFDPHGFNGSDNSHYLTGSESLGFGEGGVDDAEDADVILHELGHGIHHWLAGGISNADGLSEGCGDYWAHSYSRSLNQWPSSAPEYQWMFNWDGHNPFWAGRITNTTMTYPGSGSYYDKAQIWSAALMRIYDRIGKEKTDRAFLEGLDLTTSTTNQQNAAIAVRQAAIDMLGQFGFNCNNITAMTEEFTAAGYVLPEYSCVLSTKETAKENLISVYPNPVSDQLIVILKGNKEEKAEIYNMEGRKVMETTIGNNNNKINVSNLPSGNYILTVKGIELSAKFIKK
ncbi:T9SS C-terminal target domain-containing protein [Chryseobacterium carnipullorum]|uniref:Por secretion system C-terminal sorting domain n=1 Tax=Chryseobacterium carnipullorum TaxID=1124835 RepID=A0A376DWN6_CHRCU|nr:T9SS type A sorting domain-containing protein [Chryseobacterium carnipullorum]AZA50002.1 T9SS C-terminal target domain-containing protein [Chryseobacterium carnipullorum]STC96604.1 Por secretion system C-terminal sorting domain [Chryseobacterium carnipullorum]